MRHLGSLEEERLALRFHDYMLARGMPTRVDREGDEWAVWIVEEDHVDAARTELETFLVSPDDPKYVEAAKSAEHIRKDLAKKDKQARRQTRQVGRNWDAARRRGPVVTTWLVVASVTLCFLSLDWKRPIVGGGSFGLGAFNFRGTTALRGAFMVDLRPADDPGRWEYLPNQTLLYHLGRGEIWRVITPIFIHFGPLHLLFNMMWLRQLGSAIEFRRGHAKYLGIVLFIAVTSNVAQYLWNGPAFGGMSGVVFGLFGYVWMKSKYDPLDGFFIPPNLVFFMIAWLVLCFTGRMGPIANTAHTVGLAAGCLLGILPTWMRTLRKPAR